MSSSKVDTWKEIVICKFVSCKNNSKQNHIYKYFSIFLQKYKWYGGQGVEGVKWEGFESPWYFFKYRN